MKKIIVSLSALFAIAAVGPTVFAASNLEVAADSSFSNQTTNFNSGQTIYVRMTTDSAGDKKKQLNLRDNKYNLIQSYTFNKSGNTYSTSISAPSSEGYYSLEAQIESDGDNTTSVKTIKVGSPNNSNVKVNINNQVNNQTSTTNGSASQKPSDIESSPADNSEDQIEENIHAQTQQEPGFATKFGQFLTKLWSVIWPF